MHFNLFTLKKNSKILTHYLSCVDIMERKHLYCNTYASFATWVVFLSVASYFYLQFLYITHLWHHFQQKKKQVQSNYKLIKKEKKLAHKRLKSHHNLKTKLRDTYWGNSHSFSLLFPCWQSLGKTCLQLQLVLIKQTALE